MYNINKFQSEQSHYSPGLTHTQRTFRDAANSPIQVLETPRRIQQWNSQNQSTNRPHSRESVSDLMLSTTLNDFAITEKATENTDQVDGAEAENHVNKDMDDDDDDDDDWISPEVFYENSRRQSLCSQSRSSSRGVFFSTDNDDKELADIPNDEGDFHDGLTRTNSRVSQCRDTSQMTILCSRISEILNKDFNEETEHVSWEKLQNLVCELETRAHESDDSKVLHECESLFPLRKQEQTLYTCIQNLQSERDRLETDNNTQIERMAELEDINQQNTSLSTKYKKANADKEGMEKLIAELNKKLIDSEQLKENNEKYIELLTKEKDELIKKHEEEMRRPQAAKRQRRFQPTLPCPLNRQSTKQFQVKAKMFATNTTKKVTK